MTKEEFYQSRCIDMAKSYQAKIDKLQAQVDKYEGFIEIIKENREPLLDMYFRAVRSTVINRQLLLDGLNNDSKEAVALYLDEAEAEKQLYLAFTYLDEKFHDLTGIYLNDD